MPRKTSLNWTIPELVKSSVGSEAGTSEAEWTTVCRRCAKKSRNDWRMCLLLWEAVDGAQIGAAAGAEEDVLELDHARVGEEQRGIGGRHKRCRMDDGVLALREKVQERLADVLAAVGGRRRCRHRPSGVVGHYMSFRARPSGRGTRALRRVKRQAERA